jgi:hypothetical protein
MKFDSDGKNSSELYDDLLIIVLAKDMRQSGNFYEFKHNVCKRLEKRFDINFEELYNYNK